MQEIGAARPAPEQHGAVERARRPTFGTLLATIAVLALCARIFVVWWIPTQPISDFWSYISLAEQMINEGRYGWYHGRNTAYLAPGYPLLLAAVYGVTGSSLLVTRILNILLSTTTVVLGGLAGRALLGRAAGLVAALLLALDPRQLLQTCLAASENLGAPAMFGYLALLGWSWRRERSLRLAAVAGLVLGISALARPVVLLTWLLWPACGLVARKRLVRVAQETLVLLLTLYALLLPWGIRNYLTLGRFTTSTTTTGINFFMGNSDVSNGSWIEWRPILTERGLITSETGEGDVDRIAAATGRRWIVENPRAALRLYAYKLYRYFFFPDFTTVAEWAIFLEDVVPPARPTDALPGPHVLKRHEEAIGGVLIGTLIGMVVLAAVGTLSLLARAFRERRRRPGGVARPAALALLCLMPYFPLITAVFVVVDRYRWPLEDVLTLLAGAGVVVIASPWQRKESARRGID